MRLLPAVWRKAIWVSFHYLHRFFPLSARKTSSGNWSIYRSTRERLTPKAFMGDGGSIWWPPGILHYRIFRKGTTFPHQGAASLGLICYSLVFPQSLLLRNLLVLAIKIIDRFRVNYVRSLLISILIHTEIRTNYHYKKFALKLALKERLKELGNCLFVHLFLFSVRNRVL